VTPIGEETIVKMDITLLIMSIILAFAISWSIAIAKSWKEIKLIKRASENAKPIEKLKNYEIFLK
jgi:hypothetical protein